MAARAGHARYRLVGDIGGTNSRLALFDHDSGTLSHIRSYTNRDFPHLEDIIEHWLQALGESMPDECCLAVAAPPFRDEVTMINIDWRFSVSGISERFGIGRMRCINDFEGNALALPHLGAAALATLRSGSRDDCDKLAVIGPGTGLGGATLQFFHGTPVATASEPGHMGLSPGNSLELAVFGVLLPAHGDVYAELLLSGPGLGRLYQALAQVRGVQAEPLAASAITAAALDGSSELCAATVDLFCALLGSICGDYTLATGSYGGVYIAGGIAPAIVERLAHSDFQRRFEAKGEMRSHLARVPLHVIRSDTAGMLGAAHAPL